MNCSVIYYIAYKTGYIQRVFDKKFRNDKDITTVFSLAAVSVEDMYSKFSQALEKSDLIFVVGGLSASGERNIITVLSDYFSQKSLPVDFNKKIINSDGGKDGNLIKSGQKYIAVLPDEPEHIENMVGKEFMKNIEISTQRQIEETDTPVKHTVVFASLPDDAYNVLKGGKKSNIFLKVCIAVGILTAAAAAVWVAAQFLR